jgi:arylsulfatase A-like enzyme
MPGAYHEPRRVHRIASLIDLAPTVLDLLGLTPSPEYQGTSLLCPGPRAALFFTDYGLPLAGVRDGKWKLITRLNSPRAQLFNLETDPEERLNLSDEHPDLVAAWQRRLLTWSSTQKSLVLHPGVLANK